MQNRTPKLGETVIYNHIDSAQNKTYHYVALVIFKRGKTLRLEVFGYQNNKSQVDCSEYGSGNKQWQFVDDISEE